MTRTGQSYNLATLLGLAILAMALWLAGVSRLWADEPDQPKLAKTAYGADGQPLTGPVNVGDVVNYVLNVKVPRGPGSTSAAVKDVLSASQKYVAPSLKMPAGWSAEPVLPYSSANTTDYSIDDIAASQSLEMTVATAGSGAGAGAGDGFVPIPVGSRIYAITHHMPGDGQVPMVNCWDSNALAICPGYPKQAHAGNDGRSTSTLPDAVVVGQRFYYVTLRNPIGNATGPIDLGVGCWDTASAAPCPFLQFPGNPTIGTMVWGNSFSGIVGGLVQDPAAPTHLIALAQGKVHCVTTSGAACPGWGASGNDSIAQTTVFRDAAGEPGSGTRFFVSGPFRIGCHKYADGTPCAGWPSNGSGVSVSQGSTFALSPVPDSSDTTGSTWKAVCLHAGGVGQPVCVSAANGSAYTPPFGSLLNGATALSAYQIPNSLKVLYPGYASSNALCFDFATNALCSPFTPGWSSATTTSDYGFSSDPANPEKCFLAYGHNSRLTRFFKDGRTDPELCRPETYRHDFNLSEQFCHAVPDDVVWDKVVLSGAPANLQGTIVLSQGTSTTTINLTPGTSTYEINIPASANNGQISLAFTPSSSTPVTGTFKIKLLYDAPSGQQICYQAKVEECGEVFNDATLTSGGKTSSARVDLGKSVGPDCPEGADCLKLTTTVRLSVNGVATVTATQTGPDGFVADQFDVVSLTGGVTAVANGNVWQLTGVTPGQSVTLNVNGTRPGAGPNGVDICCESQIKIDIPTRPDDPDTNGGGGDGDDDDGLPDLSIEKDGAPVAPNSQYTQYIFTVYNTSPTTITAPPGSIVIADVVPPGMEIVGVTNLPAGWDCGPSSQFPLTAGQTLTCKNTVPVTLAPGQGTPAIFAPAKILQPAIQPPDNCSTVSTGPGLTDGNAANNKMCYNFQTGRYWPDCDRASTRPLEDGTCACRNDAMTRVNETTCACPSGQVLQGTQCVPQGSGAPVKPPPGPATPVPSTQPQTPPPVCDRATTKLEGTECVCKFENMTRKSTTACQCKRGFDFDKVKGCVKEPPDCDRSTTKLEGDRCVCLYPGMRTAGKLRCACGADENLVPGIGCVKKPPVCDAATATLTGSECQCRFPGMTQSSATACSCPSGSNFEAGFGCVPVCPDEKMTLNAARTKCECPKGYALKENKCEKESSFRFNFGIDVIPGRPKPSPGPSPTPAPGPTGRP